MGKKEGGEEEGGQQQEADGEQEGGGEEEEQDAIVHRLVLDPEGAPDRVLSVRELVRGYVVFWWFVPVVIGWDSEIWLCGQIVGRDRRSLSHSHTPKQNHPQLQPQQEIKHADDPFGQAPAEDTTGLAIWSASLVLARWLAADAAVQSLVEGAVVCELGAGCGVPGLAAAVHARPREVVITDLNPETVANLR
jgi:hypothetical protein